jgi:hypothetical protein
MVNPWLYPVAAACAAALIGVRYFSARRRIPRALRAAPRTQIGKLLPGVVRVTGRARKAEDSLVAPMTGRPCLGYQLSIDECQSAGDTAKWQPLVRLCDGHPFWVEDETGRVLVEPGDHLAMALDEDRRGGTGFFHRVSGDPDTFARLETFLKVRGIATTGWLGTRKQLRYSEGIIEDGETVSVGATAAAWGAPAGRLSLRGTGDVPMLISDLPGAHG